MRKLAFYLVFILVAGPVVAFSGDRETDETIDKVYVIFKTHLDVGFTELGSKVVDTYNHFFIPGALALSEQFAQEDGNIRYPWSTGSWLIWNYLEKASGENRTRMEEAIRRGDFRWHAMPFTTQVELADSSLFSLGLTLSQQLDKTYGRTTRSAKITDVPGLTRSAIPLFRKQGIELLHIGINPGAAVAKIPEVFRWRDTGGEEMVIIYQTDYARPLQIPGTTSVVMLNFTHDNHGPHTREQIGQFYEQLRTTYPNASIIAASLEQVADEVAKVKDSLPVVTSEIGDTWMYGVASDPKKIAQLRALMRLRNQWIEEGRLVEGSDTDLRFSFPLLMVTEHTWGLDIKTFLKNYEYYEFDRFPSFMETDIFHLMEESWNEKRRFIYQGIADLPGDLQKEALQTLSELYPEGPVDKTNFKPYTGELISTSGFQLSFDPRTGAINQLKEKKTRTVWNDNGHGLGEFVYQTYSEEDFTRFIRLYCPPDPEWWMLYDYGKADLGKTNAQSKTLSYKIKGYQKGKSKDCEWIKLSLVPAESLFGAPREVYITYTFPTDQSIIEVKVEWFDKPKNRVPEAAWFSFTPVIARPDIFVQKMGREVDARNVVENGARLVHGIDRYVRLQSSGQEVRIESMDAPLVRFNDRNMLEFSNELPDGEKGVHFNLLNTLWGTNYPQWFGEDMKFRFTITFQP
ncbi:MAG: DUF5054 domain-containing protein [Tannerellaceae bacterium]|nr:DUF5054 domain-containing protein [Tannerellaceae bacterium]